MKTNLYYHHRVNNLSGDIHKNPGPITRSKKATSAKVLLKYKKCPGLLPRLGILLFLMISVINRANKLMNEDKYQITDQSFNTATISIHSILRYKNIRIDHTAIKSASAYLNILLILSGDIHPCPGPSNRSPVANTGTRSNRNSVVNTGTRSNRNSVANTGKDLFVSNVPTKLMKPQN